MRKTLITFCLLIFCLSVLAQTEKPVVPVKMEKFTDSHTQHPCFNPGYGYHFADSCYRAVAEKVSRRDWEKAFAHRMEYNYYRDTSDSFQNSLAKLSVFRAMDDASKEEVTIWGEPGFENVGQFQETGEAIVDIWHPIEMEAVFVKNGIMDSCIIAGSDYGVYGKNRIYVGCEGFDCDNYVHLYFYRIADKPYHHTQFLCDYSNTATFERWTTSDSESEEWDNINRAQNGAMMWYKDALYFRAWDRDLEEIVYYRVKLVER